MYLRKLVLVGVLVGALCGGLAQAAAAAGTLRVNLQSALGTVDPAFAFAGLPSFQLDYAVCAKLTNLPDQPAPAGSAAVPEVAGSPRISADGKTYTFTIRGGFRFSPPSNEVVTAATFKHAIERALAPGMDPSLASFLSDVVGANDYHAGLASSISGITANGMQLTIQLVRPAGDLLARLAMPQFCAVPLDAPVDPTGNAVLASAGPYYVASHDPSGLTVLKVNPNYGGSRPHFWDEIDFQANVPAATTEADIIAGTVDYAADGLPNQDYAAIGAAYGPGSPADLAGQQQFFVDPMMGTRYLAMNTSRPLFANTLLRQAVNYALDRPALASAGGAYFHTPTDQILPPTMLGFWDWNLYPIGGPDLVTAQSLALASGQVPATAVLYAPNNVWGQGMAPIIETDLAAIGITVQTQYRPPGQHFAALARPGEPFDLGLSGWLADYPDPYDFIDVLLHGKNIPGAGGFDTNVSYFNDPVFNARMDAAAQQLPPYRYLSYAFLDRDITRDAAPWASIGTINSRDFFSARIGCQTFNPYFGIDLGALCLR